MNKKMIAKEWLIFLSASLFGFLILPLLLSVASPMHLPDFYATLGDSDSGDFVLSLLIAVGPYIIIQVTRISMWSVTQLQNSTDSKSD